MEPKNEANINFFKVISKYRNFARNVDSLGNRAKNRFFGKKNNIFLKLCLNIVIFPEVKHYSIRKDLLIIVQSEPFDLLLLGIKPSDVGKVFNPPAKL